MSRAMALVEDDENVHYGTPLVYEEELGRRKGKLVVEQGQARRLAPWHQEVTDAEGRRRFHGAFTGGFSAGYYNTVGSKEGWAPASFSSSRNQRAGKKEQQVYDFLDEDEKEELKAKELAPSTEYDALGSTADELSRRRANKEYERRPSAIPGGVPDEIIIPLAPTIGVKLLMKMGWRQGVDHITLPSGVNKGGGLGLDTLEELDRVQQVENRTDFGVQDQVENGSSSAQNRSKRKVLDKRDDCLPSFHAATHSSATVQQMQFLSPVIPSDFTSMHTLAAPLDVEQYLSQPEPPEVPSPDSQMAKNINGVAAFVARTGQRFEDILKQKHVANPQFGFLFEGSSGHEFYARKLWEEQRNLSKQGKKPIHSVSKEYAAELVGAHRGRILGEKPLPMAEIPMASLISSKDGPGASSLVPSEALSELTAQMGSRFTAGASDTVLKPDQEKWQDSFLQLSSITNVFHAKPRREENPWRPTGLLCKRFNLLDPFLGKDPIPLKLRTKTESLIMTANSLGIGAEPSHLTPPLPVASSVNDWASEDVKDAIVSENSIDLYKAIFSDDDEDEDQRGKSLLVGGSSGNQVQDPKNSDAANAISDYMAAGHFLESLGKELGLRV